jgi:hypothetical protein
MLLAKSERRKMILRFAPEIEESKFPLARNFARTFGLYFSVMKRRILVLVLLTVLLPASGFAQGQRTVDFRRGRLAGLSIEEQAKLRSAHDTAMRDPALAASRQRYEQARNEFRDKLREGLLKADPSVQPILEKVRRHRHGHRNR